VTAFEVGGDDRAILFLACSIPNIELGGLVFQSNVLNLEVDGGDLGLLLSQEVSLSEPPEESCFADVAVSHYNHFVPLFVPVIRQISLLDHFIILQFQPKGK
jgi:hypothetical protein